MISICGVLNWFGVELFINVVKMMVMIKLDFEEFEGVQYVLWCMWMNMVYIVMVVCELVWMVLYFDFDGVYLVVFFYNVGELIFIY